jgi:60 kDa SS-A/Ro ribonucleoprotein
MNYAQHMTASQTERENPAQAQNNAGGYSFVIDKWKRLDRFLIIGSSGGTYYTPATLLCSRR